MVRHEQRATPARGGTTGPLSRLPVASCRSGQAWWSSASGPSTTTPLVRDFVPMLVCKQAREELRDQFHATSVALPPDRASAPWMPDAADHL